MKNVKVFTVLKAIILPLFLSLILSGCVFNKMTVIKINGDFEVPIGTGFVPIKIKGKNASALIVRQISCGDPNKIPEIADVVIKDDKGNTGKVEVKK